MFNALEDEVRDIVNNTLVDMDPTNKKTTAWKLAKRIAKRHMEEVPTWYKQHLFSFYHASLKEVMEEWELPWEETDRDGMLLSGITIQAYDLIYEIPYVQSMGEKTLIDSDELYFEIVKDIYEI